MPPDDVASVPATGVCSMILSTTYFDGDVGTLLTITDYVFVCCCCVLCVLLLSKLGVCTVSRRCSLSLGNAVSLCIDTMFRIPSSSIKTVCSFTLTIWKGPAFCGCGLIQPAFATLSAVSTCHSAADF